MTVELEIEIALEKHISASLGMTYRVERMNCDSIELLRLAKAEPIGLIVITHSNTPASYTPITEKGSLYNLVIPFVVSVFTNDRTELYETISRVRDLVFTFNYNYARVGLLNHAISTQKYPDIIEGVFIGDFEFEVRTIYPSR